MKKILNCGIMPSATYIVITFSSSYIPRAVQVSTVGMISSFRAWNEEVTGGSMDNPDFILALSRALV